MFGSDSGNGSAGAVKLLAALGFICLAVWWLESRFNAEVVIMVVGGLFGVACFAGGALLISAHTRHTLDSVAKFNQADAQVDRYRMASMKEIARGDAYLQRAASQIQVIDAKRIDSLAQQRAGLLMDLERQRNQQPQPAQWGTDDFDGDGAFTELE